jgi:bifunctional UDP-N-acetylglucosamine pyrophosphorylase/glucosamine-1-phosphate N-acetyltransferase
MMWPLPTDKGELFLAGQSLAAWEEQLGRALKVTHPWDLLDLNIELIETITEWSDNSGVQMAQDSAVVYGEGTRILPGVYIEGKVVIGKNCKIGPNCYLRGSTSIGDDCHVGNAVELKNSVLMPGTNVGHLSYVGDSVLGCKVNFGAGTITSNLRHDGANHRSLVDGELIDTGRRKFGTIVGHGGHTGINTSIYPGRKIGANLSTLPGQVVTHDLI